MTSESLRSDLDRPRQRVAFRQAAGLFMMGGYRHAASAEKKAICRALVLTQLDRVYRSFEIKNF